MLFCAQIKVNAIQNYPVYVIDEYVTKAAAAAS